MSENLINLNEEFFSNNALAQIEISNETTFEYEPEFDDDMDEYLGAPPNILSSLPEYIHAEDFGKYSYDLP